MLQVNLAPELFRFQHIKDVYKRQLTDRTVYNNLEFVLRATGWKNKQEIQDRIEEVLQLV